MTACFDEITTPIGSLLAIADGADRLTHLLFDAEIDKRAAFARVRAATTKRSQAPFAQLKEALQAYFAGEQLRQAMTLAPAGTPFQQQVWSALARIRLGQTRTYGQIAVVIGRPGAARAVGAANARNPISILIPCHRLTGGNGALTGYAGGLEAKRWLLAHEARLCVRPDSCRAGANSRA